MAPPRSIGDAAACDARRGKAARSVNNNTPAGDDRRNETAKGNSHLKAEDVVDRPIEHERLGDGPRATVALSCEEMKERHPFCDALHSKPL